MLTVPDNTIKLVISPSILSKAVAPASITNGEFTANLAAVLHRPAFFQVPGFALKAVLGEFGDVLLGSQRVVPKNITDAGYSFVHPELSGALHDLIV